MLLKIDTAESWNTGEYAPTIHFVNKNGDHITGFNLFQFFLNLICPAYDIENGSGLKLGVGKKIEIK